MKISINIDTKECDSNVSFRRDKGDDHVTYVDLRDAALKFYALATLEFDSPWDVQKKDKRQVL